MYFGQFQSNDTTSTRNTRSTMLRTSGSATSFVVPKTAEQPHDAPVI